MNLSHKSHNTTWSAGTLLACLAIVTSAMSANAQDTGTTARNEEIVREAFNSWAEGGSVFSERLEPDMTWVIHGSGPIADTYEGIDDFVERASAPLLNRLATPLVPEVQDIWAVDDTVIVRFDGSATTTSGARYTNEFVWIFQMADGRVSDAEAFLDLVAYQEVVDDNVPSAD